MQKLLFFIKCVICRTLILIDGNRRSMIQHTEMRLSFIFIILLFYVGKCFIQCCVARSLPKKDNRNFTGKKELSLRFFQCQHKFQREGEQFLLQLFCFALMRKNLKSKKELCKDILPSQKSMKYYCLFLQFVITNISNLIILLIFAEFF